MQDEADVARAIAEVRERAGDPTGQLRAFVDFDRRLFELGGDVIRLIMEARRHHPELAAAYLEGRGRGESVRRRVFSSWPAKTWRAGVDVETAVDVFAVLVSIESFDLAITERGWTPDRVAAWWHATLVELLVR